MSTNDQASTSAAAAVEPRLISTLGPCASSHRPTGNDARPDTSSDTLSAPVTTANDHPNSARIGSTNTVKAYARMP